MATEYLLGTTGKEQLEISRTSVNLAATATIVAAGGAGRRVRVLSGVFVSAGAVTITFKDGASGTALTGAITMETGVPLTLPYNPLGWFETSVNTLLELALSDSVQVSGSIQTILI